MADAGRALISGLGVFNALGHDAAALCAALAEQRLGPRSGFFASERAAQGNGLPFNPQQVAMPALPQTRRNPAGCDAETGCALIEKVLDEALAQAGLSRADLHGRRVQFYIGGQGVQPEVMKFTAYLQRNDAEDLFFNPGIRKMHSDSYAEERLGRLLMQRVGLALPPLALSTASCSSMSALFLACRAIESGRADLVVVASWQQVSQYNLMFMGGVNALARSLMQPFSAATEGVLLGGGAALAILESEAHLQARQGRGLLRIDGFATCQGGGSGRGGQSFAPDFRTLARTVEESLEQAGIAAADVGCVFMHGNGIRGSDQAELLAVRKLWGDNTVPTVSYKAQLGYQVAASGLTDLAIAADALQQRRLLAFKAVAPLDAAGVHLHADAEPLPLSSDKLVKLGLGIEGSMAACTLTRLAG
jgi:3-oxoacyl-(acyl-carrier-protein) synthase